MKKYKQGIAPLIILMIIAIAAIGGGAYVAKTNPGLFKQITGQKKDIATTTIQVNTNATSTNANDDHSRVDNVTKNWKVYTDSKYGYQIKYPADFKQLNTAGGDGIPDALILKYPAGAFKNTNLSDATIEVAVQRITEDNCYKSNTYPVTGIAPGKPATMTINGVVFKAAHGGDSAMGHNGDYSILRTYRDGKCYSISVMAVSFKQSFYDENQPQSKVPTYDPEVQIYPIFTQIASTFTFTAASSSTQVNNGKKLRLYSNPQDKYSFQLNEEYGIYDGKDGQKTGSIWIIPSIESSLTQNRFLELEPKIPIAIIIIPLYPQPNISIDSSYQELTKAIKPYQYQNKSAAIKEIKVGEVIKGQYDFNIEAYAIKTSKRIYRIEVAYKDFKDSSKIREVFHTLISTFKD
jgi:hypothetical protein